MIRTFSMFAAMLGAALLLPGCRVPPLPKPSIPPMAAASQPLHQESSALTSPPAATYAPSAAAPKPEEFLLNIKFGNNADITIPLMLGTPFSVEQKGANGGIYRVVGTINAPVDGKYPATLTIVQWWSAESNLTEGGVHLLTLGKADSSGGGSGGATPHPITLTRKPS